MDVLLSNLWPVHAIAWVCSALIGIVVGYFLASATERVWVNGLIFFGILISLTFAFAQSIAMALQIGPQEVASFADFSAFWLRFNDGDWFFGPQSKEIFSSTFVGALLCFLCGMFTIVIKRDRS